MQNMLNANIVDNLHGYLYEKQASAIAAQWRAQNASNISVAILYPCEVTGHLWQGGSRAISHDEINALRLLAGRAACLIHDQGGVSWCRFDTWEARFYVLFPYAPAAANGILRRVFSRPTRQFNREYVEDRTGQFGLIGQAVEWHDGASFEDTLLLSRLTGLQAVDLVRLRKYWHSPETAGGNIDTTWNLDDVARNFVAFRNSPEWRIFFEHLPNEMTGAVKHRMLSTSPEFSNSSVKGLLCWCWESANGQLPELERVVLDYLGIRLDLSPYLLECARRLADRPIIDICRDLRSLVTVNGRVSVAGKCTFSAKGKFKYAHAARHALTQALKFPAIYIDQDEFRKCMLEHHVPENDIADFLATMMVCDDSYLEQL